MTQKTRNLLALLAIVIYIIIVMGFAGHSMVRSFALLIIGTYELLLSALYCWLNRPMKPHERAGELIADGVIVGAMLYVLFRFII